MRSRPFASVPYVLRSRLPERVLNLPKGVALNYVSSMPGQMVNGIDGCGLIRADCRAYGLGAAPYHYERKKGV